MVICLGCQTGACAFILKHRDIKDDVGGWCGLRERQPHFECLEVVAVWVDDAESNKAVDCDGEHARA